MSNKFAVATGNFNATSTWSDTPAGAAGAVVPVSGDNAYANGRTVTITANATCDKISTEAENGATGTGGFVLNAGVTLTANVATGGSTCLSFTYNSPSTSTLAGNVTGSATTNVVYGVFANGTGTLNVNGNITGGTWNTSTLGMLVQGSATINVVGNIMGSAGPGVTISGSGARVNVTGTVTGVGSGGTGISTSSVAGTITITGNVYGSSTAGAQGINIVSSTTVSVVGNVYGGAGSSNGYGILHQSFTLLTITGSVYGSDAGVASSGVYLNTNGTVNIIGNAVGGIQGPGCTNASNGTVKVIRAVGNGHGLGSSGTAAAAGVVSVLNSSLTYVEEIEYGALGQSPTSGPIIFTDKTSNVVLFYRPSLSKKTLIDAASVASALPAASDVRYGVTYNVGSNTGTMRVPAASNVMVNVPVDNTVGTAILSVDPIWNVQTSTLTTVGSIGERLKNTSTVASVGAQLAAVF